MIHAASCGADENSPPEPEFGWTAHKALAGLPPMLRAILEQQARAKLHAGVAAYRVRTHLVERSVSVRYATEEFTDDPVRAERSRGGVRAGEVRRASWQQWRTTLCNSLGVRDLGNALERSRKEVVEVIQWRVKREGDAPLSNSRIPGDLPVLRGHGGKPPSEKTIRKNLFGSRGKGWAKR